MIVKETMLVNVQGAANANKFYHLTVSEDSTVTARWGRVGTDGTSQVKGRGEIVYERLLRQKTSRGYEVVDIISSHSSTSIKKSILADVAQKNLAKDNPSLQGLISRLVEVNRHNIIAVSGDSMKVDMSGSVSTPLGALSISQIDRASKILDNISGKKKIPSSTIDTYLRLVPQKVPMRGEWHTKFFSEVTSVSEQRLFLDSLRSSVVMAEQTAKANATSGKDSMSDAYRDLFRYEVDICNDDEIFEHINRLFERSKNRTHAATSRMRLKRVYTIQDNATAIKRQTEVASRLGNVRQLWHGTPAFNLLSIMRSGLVVPTRSSGSYVITGRMFGDGVYFSDQSTKALNYARGYAPGQRNVNTNMSFMLLADVAMGYEFRPNMLGYQYFDSRALRESRTGTHKGHKFSSISVKGGTCGVMNNEMIVWDTDQVTLRYLCEFTDN